MRREFFKTLLPGLNNKHFYKPEANVNQLATEYRVHTGVLSHSVLFVVFSLHREMFYLLHLLPSVIKYMCVYGNILINRNQFIVRIATGCIYNFYQHFT